MTGTHRELAARAERFRALHAGPEPLILPNAWDVASALAVQRAGASAIATSSSAVAAALGYPDGEVIPADEMLTVVERVAAAVDLPVTADVESGYGLDPADLVDAVLEAGAVGINLEDTSRAAGPASLEPVARQVERIAAVRAAADASGIWLVINARVDSFLRGSGNHAQRLHDALQRGGAYVAAGADCVFPIWLVDSAAIGRLVAEVEAPVNVLLRPGAPSLAELAALGVRRISVGGGLARHALAEAESIARRLLAGDDTPFRELGED